MDQEDTYLQALEQAATFQLSCERLEIVTADKTTTLTLMRHERFDADPTDLQGTGAQFSIGVVFLSYLSSLHGERLNHVTNQETRALIQTDSWIK